MSHDATDGLTDELAAQIGAELDAAAEDEPGSSILVRAGEAACVEVVLHDEERGMVVAALTHAQARELAAALLAEVDAS